MPSCECCRSDASSRAEYLYDDLNDLYHEVMQEHEQSGCICTKPEGDKARAGQFWIDGHDTRKDLEDGDGS